MAVKVEGIPGPTHRHVSRQRSRDAALGRGSTFAELNVRHDYLRASYIRSRPHDVYECFIKTLKL